jgi:hypothetical protein
MKHELILLMETDLWPIISYSRFSFLTSVNIRKGLTQIIRKTLPGPKPKKALVLGCKNRVKKWA